MPGSELSPAEAIAADVTGLNPLTQGPIDSWSFYQQQRWNAAVAAAENALDAKRDPYNVGPDGVAVWRYLDLSVMHLPASVREALSTRIPTMGTLLLPVIYPYEYGWWMHAVCEEDADKEAESHYPQAIRDILAFARFHQCSFVKFDADGTITPGLKTYE